MASLIYNHIFKKALEDNKKYRIHKNIKFTIVYNTVSALY